MAAMINWLSPAINFPEEHAAIGALAVAIAYIFPPGRLGDPARPHAWIPRIAVAGFVLVVFLKELLWDPVNEIDQPFLWAGAMDFALYLVGAGAMLAALWARFHRV
jgi:hypothetical protein